MQVLHVAAEYEADPKWPFLRCENPYGNISLPLKRNERVASNLKVNMEDTEEAGASVWNTSRAST